MRSLDKTIGSVVEENYVYARALHHLGIEFFENEHLQLDKVCRERGISRQQVIKCFYEFDKSKNSSFSELASYPIDLLLEYLRHAHYLFIKEKLPYILFLLTNCNQPHIQELQGVFPAFLEDFIRHIYDEEDSLFKYTRVLYKMDRGRYKNPSAALMPYKNFSLKEMQGEHHDEDEMQNLRELIEDLNTPDLHTQVIVSELKAFDREVLYHAEIENEILFPKALELEEAVWAQLRRLSKLN